MTLRFPGRCAGVVMVAVSALVLSSDAPLGRQQMRGAWLDHAIRQAARDERLAVWVFFTDKGAPSAPVAVTSRAARRRALRGVSSSEQAEGDRAISSVYRDRVSAMVSRVRHESRWLNALSVDATPAEIDALGALPFVARLDVVRRYRRTPEPIDALPDGKVRSAATIAADEPLDYGTGVDQVRQIGVPELHQRGLHGEGMVVAVFDSGFANLAHEAFSSMTIVAERDFVGGADTVRQTLDDHGTNTLSALGGYAPGQLVGPAYKASFLLAVTEDVGSETPIEEDHWAAAAEWAEALGADVISSSLGYAAFDAPHASYADADMNGATAITTRAAALAAQRGIVVVNSAGNDGLDATDNTLVAPGDGVQVLTVGAVTRAGVRTGFSSVGPTADGRIKPDVMAMGSGVKVARDIGNAYGLASGTSFSCPLTAGVAALVLQAHPDYTVDQVLHVLRSTASRADEPSRLMGWGIVNAVAAVDAPPPVRSTPAPR